MDTLSAFRLFCDGQTSVRNIYALLESMGHSREDLVNALAVVVAQQDTSIRYREGGRDDLIGEIFIKVDNG